MKHLWKAFYYVDLSNRKTKKHIVTELTTIRGLKDKIKKAEGCSSVDLVKAVYLGKVEE